MAQQKSWKSLKYGASAFVDVDLYWLLQDPL
jgi:hypothetical protein